MSEMKPYVFCGEDEGITVEWISDYRRFGISIDKNIKDSSWWYVDRDHNMECGDLPEELLVLFRRCK